jgi:hypothetical protein
LRRTKLVLGVAAVMATMLVAFAAPAMADDDFSNDGFSSSPGIISGSSDGGSFWTTGDDVVLWGDGVSWSDGVSWGDGALWGDGDFSLVPVEGDWGDVVWGTDDDLDSGDVFFV